MIGCRTQLVNQIRGLLAEYGIVLPQQVAQLCRPWSRLEVQVAVCNCVGDPFKGMGRRFESCRADQVYRAFVRPVATERNALNDVVEVPETSVLSPSLVPTPASNGWRLASHEYLHTALLGEFLRTVVSRIHMADHAHSRIGRQHALDALGHRIRAVSHRDLPGV